MPLLMSQYVLPLRNIVHAHQKYSADVERLRNKTILAKQRDISEYHRLSVLLRNLEDNENTDPRELALVKGKHRRMEIALSLLKGEAAKQREKHLLKMRMMFKDGRELLKSAIQVLLSAGIARPNAMWDELDLYKSLFTHMGRSPFWFPSVAENVYRN